MASNTCPSDRGDDCQGCPECMDCADCGIDLTEHDRLAGGFRCAWCRADAEGRPYGGCADCGGASDWRGTCACKPNPTKIKRRW